MAYDEAQYLKQKAEIAARAFGKAPYSAAISPVSEAEHEAVTPSFLIAINGEYCSFCLTEEDARATLGILDLPAGRTFEYAGVWWINDDQLRIHECDACGDQYPAAFKNFGQEVCPNCEADYVPYSDDEHRIGCFEAGVGQYA